VSCRRHPFIEEEGATEPRMLGSLAWSMHFDGAHASSLRKDLHERAL